jgi:hypothetical protein
MFKEAHAPFYLLALVHPNFLPVNAKTIYANTIISLKSIIKTQQRELTIPGIYYLASQNLKLTSQISP